MSGDSLPRESWETTPYQHLTLSRRGFAAVVTLNRPEVRNAFNATLIAELADAFERLSNANDIRAIVLQGAGKLFSAGADLNWMGASMAYTHDDNIADALKMSDMLRAIDTCRHPVIGRLHGAALGGGVGLAAVCDLVIAAEGTLFGFTEARLGIAPAVISQFVVPKIGQSQARALFITAEQFDARKALDIGLIHKVVPAEQLDEAITATLLAIGANGPAGVRAGKLLARTVTQLEPSEASETTAATIASLRVSEEGQEGIRAFLEKRAPRWKRDDV
ncbi:MAG TPA: enoyl-CoA hydratase-related protein [Ktedonobacterales bacterium]